MSENTTFSIAVFEGDGIGAEIMPAALEVLKVATRRHPAIRLAFESLPAGASHYAQAGIALPEMSLEAARNADAILLAAMGLPSVRYPDGTEIAPQIELRKALALYAGVRPVTIYPGVTSPLRDSRAESVDFVLVRESTEGLFASTGERSATQASETMIITKDTSEKLFDFTFALAQRRKSSGRGKGRVTCVDKANVFQAFAFFREIFLQRAQAFPDLDADSAYVDATALRMVQSPWEFDVLVTENMFGDILSDLGAGIMGSLGLAPSADIGDNHAVFQPCHGSAPDIAGKNVANPVAMILSASMMLEWLGHKHDNPSLAQAAQDIEDAVKALFSQTDLRSPDLGGTASTQDITQFVIDTITKGAIG